MIDQKLGVTCCVSVQCVCVGALTVTIDEKLGVVHTVMV